MASAWVCPVCNRGMAPQVTSCDHGGSAGTCAPVVVPPTPLIPPGTNPYPSSPPWGPIYYGGTTCEVNGNIMLTDAATAFVQS